MAAAGHWRCNGKRGIEPCKSLGFDVIIVVGYAAYYPRFGFRPASAFQLRAPFDVPGDVFMALELQPGSLKNIEGLVQYPKEFFMV